MSAEKDFLLELAWLIERHGAVDFYYTPADDGVHIRLVGDADDCFVGHSLTPAALRAAAARQDHDQYAPGGRPHGR